MLLLLFLGGTTCATIWNVGAMRFWEIVLKGRQGVVVINVDRAGYYCSSLGFVASGV